MDGFEAASLITKMNTGTPIVAMTANVIATMDSSYKDSGMEGHISKPFTTQDLWRMLLKYFDPAKEDFLTNSEYLTNATNIEAGESSSAHESKASMPNSEPNHLNPAELDSDFFDKMLVQFAKSNRNIYSEISDAINSKDYSLAHRLVHNLKSNAGHIKKNALAIIAAEIESELRAGWQEGLGTQLIDDLKTELEIVLTELMPLLETEKISPETARLDAEEAKNMLRLLEPLLLSGNAAYLDYVDKLRSFPNTSGVDGSNLVEVLIEYMENFDSQAAIPVLETLKRALEVED